MSILTNIQPYFDDFDSKKNYVKLLFNPGKPLQVRELNVLQSTFENQIKKFANSIFQNGSRVTGAGMTFDAHMSFLFNVDFDDPIIENLKVGSVLRSSSFVEGAIIAVDSDYNGKTRVFYVPRGLSNDAPDKTVDPIFKDGDVLKCYDEGTEVATGITVTDKKLANLFIISKGVFYYGGKFIDVDDQSIGSSFKFETGPYKIGLDIIEEIITPELDGSLYDNAYGYDSEGAPGAHRHKITALLSARRIDADTTSFITIATVTDQGVRFLKEFSEYSELGDFLAKRTFEESGNYTVNHLTCRLLEHKAEYVGDPNGYDVAGLHTQFVVDLSPFTAYIQGYRINEPFDTYHILEKNTSTQLMTNLEAVRGSVDVIKVKIPLNGKILPSIDWGIIIASEFQILDVTDTSIGKFNISGFSYTGASATELFFDFYCSNVSITSGKSIRNGKKIGCSAIDPSWKIDAATGTVEVITGINTARITDLTNKLPVESVKVGGNSTVDAITMKKFDITVGGAGVVNLTGHEFVNGTYVAIIDGKTLTKIPIITGNNAELNFDAPFYSKSGIIFALCKESNIAIRKKTYRSNIQTIVNTIPSGAVILPVTDIVEIDRLYLKHKVTDAQIELNKNDFVIFDGQTDSAYLNATITPKSTLAWHRAILTDNDLYITYSHFEHDPTTTYGIFVSDSYEPSVFEKIKRYLSASNEFYDLKTAIDYRPTILQSQTILESPYILPSQTITFDASVFVKRIDTIEIDRNGRYYILQGVPAPFPIIPQETEGRMKLVELHQNAYSTSAKDIICKVVNNQRYTMHDIGKIDRRIDTAEYYAALNLTEQSAESMAIKDQNGLDRFKNGFIADNFQKWQAADLETPEFRAAMDRVDAELRPSFDARHRTLKFNPDKSSGFKLLDSGMVLADYVHEPFSSNTLASESSSVNPYFVAKSTGKMLLEPNIDTWSDTKQAPSINLEIDTGANAFAETIKYMDGKGVDLLKVEFGSWQRVGGVTKAQPSSVTQATVKNGTFDGFEQRSVTTDTIGTKRNETNWSQVTDVSINPFIREQKLMFQVSGLKASTFHQAFFDDVNVTGNCINLSGEKDLVSDAQGNLVGVFYVDGATFFTGTKEFWVGTVTTFDERDSEANYSTATAVFFSGNIDQTVQSVTIGTVSPVLEKIVTYETRKVEVPPPPPPPPPIVVRIAPPAPPAPRAQIQVRAPDPCAVRPAQEIRWPGSMVCERASWRDPSSPFQWIPRAWDPIAQSFIPQNDILLTGIDIFLNAIDADNPNIWVSCREMENGYPVFRDMEVKSINLLSVNAQASSDASVPFFVEFDNPVALQKGKQYCFVIGGWSPETRVWVSKVGGTTIDTNEQITTQPTLETFFKSANGSTWNAEQYHDMKYTLYCAKFVAPEMSLHFDSVAETEIIPESNPIESQAGSDVYRMHYRNHGLIAGDKFTLTVFKEAIYEITLDRFELPEIGRIIYAQSGHGTIKKIITSDSIQKTVSVLIGDIKGVIQAGEKFNFGNLPIVDIKGNFLRAQTDLTGTITNMPGDFNIGIPLSDFAKTFSVKNVDSTDSFTFDLGSVNLPKSSTRFGGDLMIIPEANMKYDLFSASGLVYLNGGSAAWSAQGIGHYCEAYPDYDYKLMQPISMQLDKNVFLDTPQKLASVENEAAFIKDASSFMLSGKFMLTSEYLSPMINTRSMSGIFVSNNVGWFDQESSQVLPNAEEAYFAETVPWKGSERYKYVTKTVTLKNSADDISIVVDANKDINADFDLYYKVAYDHDSTSMDLIDWKKVPDFVKKDAARGEFIEHSVRLSEIVTGWDGKLFNRLKVKIVGRTKNPSKPPLFKNLRIVATT